MTSARQQEAYARWLKPSGYLHLMCLLALFPCQGVADDGPNPLNLTVQTSAPASQPVQSIKEASDPEDVDPSEKSPPNQGLFHYGAYLDLSYPLNFNTSAPHPWRDKLTTNRLNEFSPNLGMVYFRKDLSEASRWGVELAGQAGYDTSGEIPGSSRLGGAEVLQYVSRANVSYLAPIGRGLTITAGLFNSFIGYESFLAKDNPNYTRSWMSDYSPYFMMGLSAQYPLSDKIGLGFYLLNDWNYLGYVNDQPKYGAQLTWQLSTQLKWTQNVFFGPEQANTSLKFWRGFSDTQLQWSDSDYSVGFAYDVGTEQLASNHLQAFWTGTALFTRWHIAGPWSVALRPELYWDPNGAITGHIQFIKAITSTVEYALPTAPLKSVVRAEYRYDNSTGQQGGFYGSGGVYGPLVPGQSSIFFALLVSYDK